MQSEMQGLHNATGADTNSEPRGCCCGRNATCSELPGPAISALPREKNTTSEVILATMIHMLPSFNPYRGATNGYWRFTTGPPVPSYLLKVSLLR